MHLGFVGCRCYDDSVLADKNNSVKRFRRGYLRSCGHRDSELDLKKHLNRLVFLLPFRQNGDSSGAANVFRTQPLAIALQPSGESARPST